MGDSSKTRIKIHVKKKIQSNLHFYVKRKKKKSNNDLNEEKPSAHSPLGPRSWMKDSWLTSMNSIWGKDDNTRQASRCAATSISFSCSTPRRRSQQSAKYARPIIKAVWTLLTWVTAARSHLLARRDTHSVVIFAVQRHLQQLVQIVFQLSLEKDTRAYFVLFCDLRPINQSGGTAITWFNRMSTIEVCQQVRSLCARHGHQAVA